MLQVFVFGPVAMPPATGNSGVSRSRRALAWRSDGSSRTRSRARRRALPARLLPVTEGIWRADLFTDDAGVPVYHHHPDHDGDVGERHFDEQLTSDPIAFVMDRLADLPSVLREGGAADIIGAVESMRSGRRCR